MMKKLVICLLMLSILLGCQKTQTSRRPVEDSVEKLNIYILGDATTEHIMSENKTNVFYTTLMRLGEYCSSVCYGEQGFLFYEAFQQYEEQTGIELELHWYRYPDELEKALASAGKNELPDLIITNYTSTADFYRYMKQGLFYDLTPYTEEEELYTQQAYYNSVLEAGRLGGKQYILPILFNIDTVMGNTDNWQRLGLQFEKAQTHEEFMNFLLNAQQQKETAETAGQFLTEIALYTPYIVYDSAGETWIDYETGEVQLDAARFGQMAEFYRNFLLEQFDEVTSGEDLSWAHTRHIEAMRAIAGHTEEYLDDKGCIVEGGGAFQSALHSAAAQAWYYESRYQDMGRSLALEAIPGKDQGVTAHVSYFGGVLSTTQYPQASYDFLRYLMDAEFFCGFGLSVNRDTTASMLKHLTELEYELRYGMQATQADGTPYKSSDDYVIHPMSEQTKEKLEGMLERISSVSLPDWPVYEILWKQLESYGKEEISLETAYETAYQQLESYAKLD